MALKARILSVKPGNGLHDDTVHPNHRTPTHAQGTASSALSDTEMILRLQLMAGNAAVSQLLTLTPTPSERIVQVGRAHHDHVCQKVDVTHGSHETVPAVDGLLPIQRFDLGPLGDAVANTIAKLGGAAEEAAGTAGKVGLSFLGRLGARLGVPLAVAAAILLTPSSTAPPWEDEINPETGKHYENQQEWEEYHLKNATKTKHEDEDEDECRKQYPEAMSCKGDPTDQQGMKDRVRSHLLREGFTESQIGRIDCSKYSTFTTYDEVAACDNAPGETWHCFAAIKNQKDKVKTSIFRCLCCNEDGSSGYNLRHPH